MRLFFQRVPSQTTMMIRHPLPVWQHPKWEKKKTKYNFEPREKTVDCYVCRIRRWIDYYFLQPKGILFAVHAFYREKCRLEACIGVGEMGGVRLNTCQYCAPPSPPHSLSSNKFFFISFVIYLWLIMQRREEEPHRKSGLGDFSVVRCGRRRDRYSAIHGWRWWRRKTRSKCDNIYIETIDGGAKATHRAQAYMRYSIWINTAMINDDGG